MAGVVVSVRFCGRVRVRRINYREISRLITLESRGGRSNSPNLTVKPYHFFGNLENAAAQDSRLPEIKPVAFVG